MLLAKVDIDENQELAAAFQVRPRVCHLVIPYSSHGMRQVSSVPYVVGVKGGKPISGFMGAQAEPRVKEFVSELMAAEVTN